MFPRAHFTLYVTPGSPPALGALRVMKYLETSFGADQVAFRVVSPTQLSPEEMKDAGVMFTPSLVLETPGSRMWFVGPLQTPGRVFRRLLSLGFRPRVLPSFEPKDQE